MKPSTKLIPGLLALLLTTISYAQKMLRPFPKNEWHVENNVLGFRESINYLPAGGAIVAADFNKGQCGATRIDEKGKTLWEYKVKGSDVAVSRMNNNVIVIYSNRETATGAFSMKNTATRSMFRAAILNIENGKLVKDILMYDNGKKVILDSRLLTRSDGSFSSLFVRVTNNDGYIMGGKKSAERTLTSDKFLIITIDNNFSSQPIEIKSPGLEGYFTGAESGANDDLYLSYILDDQLVTERINSNGKLANKLSAPFSMKTNNNYTFITSNDTKNPGSYFIAADFTSKDKDNVQQAFEFNFVQNKVLGTGEQQLDKNYLKSFDVTEIKELRNTYKASNMEEYSLLNFLIAEDRIVIIKGYKSTLTNGNTNTTHFQSGRVAIEIFDRQWKRLKGIALDRRFELFDPVCQSVGATINNGKLYTIFPAFSGLNRVETLFAQIDLNDLKVDKFIVLDNSYISRSARGPVIESDGSIWLKDGVLMENCGDEGGIFSSKTNISSMWQKLEY